MPQGRAVCVENAPGACGLPHNLRENVENIDDQE